MGATPLLTDPTNIYGVSIFNRCCINNGKSQADPAYEEFALNVEDVQHVINRNPSVFALPGQNTGVGGSGLPKIYSIDFGMLEETIILSGSIADGEDNQYLPTVHDIMRIARTWWSSFSLDGADTLGFSRLLLQTHGAWNDASGAFVSDDIGAWNTEIYGFTFQNVQTSRAAGSQEWGYKATLAIVKFPEEDDPSLSGALAWMAP